MKSDDNRVVRVPGWEQYLWLRHGFSTRIGGLSTVYGDGDLNLGWTKDDDPKLVAGNRRRLLESVGWDAGSDLLTVRQVHGTQVLVVAEGKAASLIAPDGRAVLEADGLMTAVPGVMLAVQAADCVPVLLADVRQRVVAGFHAGWRGTAAGIVELGVAKMIAEFGSRPEDLVGAVGPAIGACSYTVGEEVRERFAARFGYAAELFQGDRVDLWEANRRQLLGAGLREDRVTVVGECTACARVNGRRKYFSHRAEKGFTGRAMGVIGVVG
jgi:YfiH family protein